MNHFRLHQVLLFLGILFCANSVMAQNAPKSSAPVSLILDTDIGPDYDDVGAIALMHALADKGECRILATIASDKYANAAAVLSVLNTYFKRPQIPIGVPKGKAVDLAPVQGWDSVLVTRYPHSIKTNAQAQDAIALYRKILAQQPDKSVTIVTVGFLTNMANLLDSKADKLSPLSGKELVQKKVKQLVCMAGGFPKGDEFNVNQDAASSKKTFDNWPTPITFSGFEIGERVFTGLPLIKSNIQNSPVKDVFAISIPKGGEEDKNGRKSWDQTAVLVAIRGWEKYYTVKPGKFVCQPKGTNTWDSQGKNHQYLVEKMPAAQVSALINELMMHQPKAK